MGERSTAHVAYRTVLLAAGLLVLGLLFRQLLTLLLAVLMTVIIAIPLSACATRLERRGVPRPLGALLGLLTGLAAIALIVYLLIPPFVDETNQFVNDVPGIVNDLRHLTGASPGELGDRVQRFAQRYTDDPARLIGPITSIGLSLAGVLGATVLILITAYYMAVRPDPLIDGMLALVPPARRVQALRIMQRLRAAWIGWMEGVAVDMLGTGLLLWIGLSLIGLDFAVFFSVLTAVLVVVPYFGVIAGALPPTLFALTDSTGKGVLVLIVYVLVQQIESNVTIPRVMSRRMRLHPAVIAIGVVVVAQLFGFIGLFVAVPILSMIIIVVDEVWVGEIEAAAPPRPRLAQLDDRDDGAGEDEGDDQDLHDDPEARQLHRR